MTPFRLPRSLISNPSGVRAHTMSSANFADVRLSGRSVPEAGLNAAIAGHFGVPVVLVTGANDRQSRMRGIDAGEFQKLAEAAKDGCPISQALKGNVDLKLKAELDHVH